jgi:hypothetical protein
MPLLSCLQILVVLLLVKLLLEYLLPVSTMAEDNRVNSILLCIPGDIICGQSTLLQQEYTCGKVSIPCFC